MEAFRVYLDGKFTDTELASRFGISDIASFNYGEWIKDNNGPGLLKTDLSPFLPFVPFPSFASLTT